MLRLLVLAFLVTDLRASAVGIEYPVVLTQLPAGTEAELGGPLAGGMLRANYGEHSRIVLLRPDLSTRILSEGFHSACDPDVSFDGDHILFAGKRTASDDWNIFEMDADGSNVKQITSDERDHRSPGYQATLYTIVSDKPWYQLTYVASEQGILNEYGMGSATSLYSCKLDGSAARRLTFNLSSDMDPFIMPDGRLLLASWQRSNLERGLTGRISLFGVNIDGADYAAFCGAKGKRIKHMPCTTKDLAVFVEADRVPWDGSGTLGCVSLRRPLHYYRSITDEADGLFHSPSGLPDGSILVSRRSADGHDTHGLYRLDPQTGQCELVFDSPDYHEIQAKAVYQRSEPDGRSSVVTEKDPHGKLYCLSVNISDMAHLGWSPPGMVKRLRVLEGIPLTGDAVACHGQESPKKWHTGAIPRAQRRILGEIRLDSDGSFNIEVPANVPIELQMLDADGIALRSCSWIWAKNHEPRGCIGCHEDGELTPENALVDAVTRDSVKLTLPAERRRTVDFRRDVMPIIATKCAQCHDNSEARVHLTGDMPPALASNGKVQFNLSYTNLLAPTDESGKGRYVHPGKARTSPLTWHLFGRNTSRPWDGTAREQTISRMPAEGQATLTENEKRTFVEWIDMGAHWDGIPQGGEIDVGTDTFGGSHQ